MATAPPRVDVTAVGLAAADSVAWRHKGHLRISVVVKATFALLTGGDMTQVRAEEILRAEVSHDRNPARTVRLTDDLAPFLPRADVLLTGHACAPAGAPLRGMAVRLAVLRDVAVLDKTLHVRGPQKGGATAPFERIPLVYERAYGGVGFDDNPLGTGAGPGAEEPPNLFDPTDPRKVACFAPMSRVWPTRARLVSREDRRALGAPVAEVAAQLDWSYFQAAPLDQRIDYLKGDEQLVLEGFHASRPRVASRLPGARAQAVAYGLPAGAHVVALVADTLRIDADAMLCSVTWRGSFAVPDAWDGVVKVLAGVESKGRPIVWPAAVPGEPASEPAEDVEDVTDLAQTMSGDELTGPASAPDLGSTVMLRTVDTGSAPRSPVLPFREGEPATPMPSSPRVEGDAEFGFGTMVADEHFEAPPSLPFQRPAPSPRQPPAPPAAPPAAPPVVEIEQAPILRAAARVHPRSAEGIELVNGTPLLLGTVPWGLSPSRDCLTVFAKATCALVPGGAAVLRPAAAITAADRALFKVRADVVLVGHACAPAGPVSVMEVRFAFGAEGNAFARRLRVSGDRRWERGVAPPRPSAPEPFVRMPLVWERAFGGPRLDANPAGVGHADAMRRARPEPVPLPNLEDPGRLLRTPAQTPAPACFAPTPLEWKDRPGRRASPHLPEDFDWTRFQTAPAEQQLAFLRGDEPFEIAGCRPRDEVLAGTLPGLLARCFSLRQGRFEEIPLRLDTVVLETDEPALHLVWRGAVGVPDERAPGIQALYLMTERTGDEPATLAEARARLAPG